MASPSPFNQGNYYGPGIGYRGANRGHGAQNYPKPYQPRQQSIQTQQSQQRAYDLQEEAASDADIQRELRVINAKKNGTFNLERSRYNAVAAREGKQMDKDGSIMEYDPDVQRVQNVAKAKKSGAFNVARDKYNKVAAREGKKMDDDGNIVGIDSAPTQTLYTKGANGRYKASKQAPIEAPVPLTQEELDAQRKDAILGKYAKGQSISDDAREEAGLPDTPRLSSADIAAAKARKEQADLIAAQEAEQAVAREAALTTSKEKKAAEVGTHKAYANSLKTKLMLATRELQPLEAAEKAAQTNLALPKPDKAAITAARARRDDILKQVDAADSKVLESSVAYQKHLDEAATEGAKIDVFKAGIKTRRAKAMQVGGITVNATPVGMSFDRTTGRLNAGGQASTEAKPDPQQSSIFGNAINNPFAKKDGVDSPVANDPANIVGSKLMQQRMQMAQSEEDPNVRHYAQKDVEARTADPVKWEKAQYDTVQELSDEDLAGKLQLMPQVIEQGKLLLQQSQLEARAEQEGYQQRLAQIEAAKAKDQDKPFTMADSKINPTTGQRWHSAHLDNYENTVKQADEAQAKAVAAMQIDEGEVNRDVAVHNARAEEAKRREANAKAKQDEQWLVGLRDLDATGRSGLGGDLMIIKNEQREKAEQINPFIERGSDEHKAAMAVIEEETQARVEKAAKEADSLPEKAAELYKNWGRDQNNNYLNWITNESPYDQGRSKGDSESTRQGYVQDVQRRKDLLNIQASKLGVNPKDLAYQLETNRILDWSKPLTEKADIQQNSLMHETAKKFGWINEVEPTRTLPNGMVTVNPAMGADQAEFEAAIKTATASKEGKEQAKTMWPAYHAAWLEKASETLSHAQALPGVEDFNEWTGRNLDAGKFYKDGPDGKRVLMTQNEQTQKYIDEMKGRGNFRKLLDNVSSGVMAGSHDIMTAVYGVSGMFASAAGKATGWSLGGETLSKLAADKSQQADALTSAHSVTGTDTIMGSKLLGGAISQTARMLPGMAPTMATGSMSGAMLAGAIQTGGMQYAETYNNLRSGPNPLTHDEAFVRAAPNALYSGVMTAVLTKAFPGGITALNNKANQAILRQSVGQAIKSYASGSARAAHAIAKGMLDEIPQETMDEFNSQMSQAMAEGKSPKQAVSSFIANLPELVLSTGIAGGLGGLGDIDGKGEGSQPGVNHTAAPTGISPADQAAIDKAIKNYTGGASTPPEESARTRNLASAIVKIKGGAMLAGLTQAELAATGYERKADKIVPIKDVPQAAYEQDGKVVITDPAIQEINDAIPATNILGLKTESERLDDINKPATNKPSESTSAERSVPKAADATTAVSRSQISEPSPPPAPENLAGRSNDQSIEQSASKANGEAEDAKSIDTAAHEAATSPLNDKPQPTEAQQAAGNYKLGKFKLAGMTLTVEHPQGSTRGWTDQTGRKGQTVMQDHYGRILGTVGMDGDHLDAFINPGTPEDFDGDVYVVDQSNPKTGTLDEHKIMVGYPSLPAAREAYLRNYEPGWKGLKKIAAMPISQLAESVKSGNLRKSPSTKSNANKNPNVPSKRNEKDSSSDRVGIPDSNGKTSIRGGDAGGSNGIGSQRARDNLLDDDKASTKLANARPTQQPATVSTGNQTATSISGSNSRGVGATGASVRSSVMDGGSAKAVDTGNDNTEDLASGASSQAAIPSEPASVIAPIEAQLKAHIDTLKSTKAKAEAIYLRNKLVATLKPYLATGIWKRVLVMPTAPGTAEADRAGIGMGVSIADRGALIIHPQMLLHYALQAAQNQGRAKADKMIEAGPFHELAHTLDPNTDEQASDLWNLVDEPTQRAFSAGYFQSLPDAEREAAIDKWVGDKAMHSYAGREYFRAQIEKALLGEISEEVILNKNLAKALYEMIQRLAAAINDFANTLKDRKLAGEMQAKMNAAAARFFAALPKEVQDHIRTNAAKEGRKLPEAQSIPAETTRPAVGKAPPQQRIAIAKGMAGGPAYAEFATPTDADAYRWYSNMKSAMSPGKKDSPKAKAAIASTLLARVAEATKLAPTELRTTLIAYNKTVREQAKGVAEGEAFHAPTLQDFIAKQSTPVATASEATSNEGGGINGPRPAGGSIQAVDTPTLTNNGGMSRQNMGAPAVSEAEDRRYMAMAKDPAANREKLQAMVDKAAKGAGLVYLSRVNGDGAPTGYYHHNNASLGSLIATEGASRKIDNGSFEELKESLAGVEPKDVEPLLTSEESDDGTRDVYNGNHRLHIWKDYQVLPIDTPIPILERVDEADAVVTDESGEVVSLSDRFNYYANALQMAPPKASYRSPTDMLAATQAQMQGKAGEKPAGLSSMFNPQAKRPATGERTLFEMPKNDVSTKKPQESAEKASKTPKSSTQLTLSAKYAAPILAFGESIPKRELYDSVDPEWSDGALETEPHVTVLYGLTKHEADPVAQTIAGHGPVTVTLGKMLLFESDDYDVLKIDVESPELRALNAKISKLPNENSFPDYKPHMTIAYLKKGEGEKYVGDDRFEGKKITFDTMTFSPPSELRGELGRPELSLTKPIAPRSIHAAYASAASGNSSAYVTLDGLYNALKANEPAITPKQMADMLRKMDENGEASLEISEDSETTLRNREKYGLLMGTVPASGVAIHPREAQQMSAPMPQREAFYSKLTQVIEAKMPVRADAKAVRGMIGNQSSGVKAEEIKWSGINQWLEGREGLIEKADVLAYLNGEGAVRFVEHRMSDKSETKWIIKDDADREEYNTQEEAEDQIENWVDAYVDSHEFEYPDTDGWTADEVDENEWKVTNRLRREMASGFPSEEAANKYIQDAKAKHDEEVAEYRANVEKNIRVFAEDKTTENTQYSQYQLPGGTNYREVVLAMPEKSEPTKGYYIAKSGGYFNVYDGRSGIGQFETMEEAQTFLRSKLGPDLTKQNYTSSHFTDVPNYVAHMRLNDRTDAEGQEGTFIEEIQSDRHQAGREKGYRETLTPAEQQELDRFSSSDTSRLSEAERSSGLELLNKSALSEGIPDAPYRTSWPIQLFKRALAEAVSTGKAWIGWTQGATHTDRWGTERIEWLPQNDGSFLIDAKAQHGGMAGDVDLEVEANSRNMNAKNAATVRSKAELIEAIKPSLTEGQDPEKLGEKIWTRMQTERSGVSFPRKEGFEGFYDTILPAAVNDYTKQWKNEDGSKPKAGKQEIAIQPDNQWDVIDDNGGLITSFPTKEGAEKWAAGRSGRNVQRNETAFTNIWRVDITPAMAASVEAGQALFMAAPSQQAQANIDAATYDFARPAPPSDPGHIRNAKYIPKRGLQSNPQLPLVSAFYQANSLRAKMGQTIRSFENDWAPFFDFINDMLPAEKRKAGLMKIVNKFGMSDTPESKALWKAYAAMPIKELLPADSERVKEAKELLPYLENLEAQMMSAPKDQGDLDSRVLKRLADQLPEDDYLDQLDIAHSESFPEGSEGDWLRALQKEKTTPDTVKAWDKAARRMIAKDPQAVIDEIVNNFYEGKSFGSPELALAGSILSADVLKQAQLSGDEAMLRKARAFSYAVGAGETQAGRELRALNNPHKSNRERVAEVIANLFTTPPPAIRAKIANAPSPSAKLKKIAELQKRIKELEKQIVSGDKAAKKQAAAAQKELAAALREPDKAQLVDEALAKREKKVKEALANEGLTVEDVLLTPEDRLAAQDSEIVERARAKHTAGQQKALLWIGRGFSDTDVAKFSGMDRGAVATLREDYRNNSLKPEIAKELKKGRSIIEVIKDSFKKAFGIQMAAPMPWGNVQRVKPAPPKPPANKAKPLTKVEDTVAAEIDRMLDILAPNARAANGNSLLAAVVKGKNGTRVTIQVPFDAEDFRSVHRVARAISISEASGYDKMYEYWINNLLSGPQTNVVNIIGNLLSVGLHYAVQRPLETIINTAARDPESAQWGEWGHIIRGMAGSLGEAWQNAVTAFAAEADPTAHRYLNEPIQISFTPTGDVAKMGGYRGPSIKGLKGRAVRVFGGTLRMMDAIFKTFILHAEVGAMAYRLAKIEQNAGRIGSTGADLEAHIKSLVDTKGSKAWMQSMKTALELTFQNESILTDTAKQFTSGREHAHAQLKAEAIKAKANGDISDAFQLSSRAAFAYAVAKMMRIIFPFVRTPSNIATMGIRKSPLGGVWLAGNILYMMGNGLTNKIKGRDFFDNYPKAVLVKLLAEQLFVWPATLALLFGTEGDDDDDKKKFLLVGGRPWKKKGDKEDAYRDYGGTYIIILRDADGKETRIPFGRYEPVATILGITVDSIRRMKEMNRRAKLGEPGGDIETMQKAIMGDLMNQFTDKSFLQGVSGVVKELDALQDSGNLSKGLASTIGKFIVTAIVPNFIRQPMRNIDDKVRDPKLTNNWYNGFPMGDNAEAMKDVFGNEIEKGGNGFLRILFPVANKQTEQHPIVPLLHEWNNKHVSEKIQPVPMDRSGYFIYGTDGKTKIPLVTPQEKSALQSLAGRYFDATARTMAENLAVAKKDGGELPSNFDDQVKTALSKARTAARQSLLQSSPFLAAKQKQP